jgi:hypothetical protein
LLAPEVTQRRLEYLVLVGAEAVLDLYDEQHMSSETMTGELSGFRSGSRTLRI